MKNFKSAAQSRLKKNKIKKMAHMASSNSVKPVKVKPAQQLNALSWKPAKPLAGNYGKMVSEAAKNKIRKTDAIRKPDVDRGDSQDRGAGQVRIGKPPVVARKGVKWNTP